MSCKLDINQVDVTGCNEKMFVEFFSIDSDFSDNEEYFREDTLKLGFNNEAERCSKELFDKFKEKFNKGNYSDVLDEALEEAAQRSVEGNQFILSNNTYTSEFYISMICINEKERNYIVVTSRVSS